jgi:hypothetical protein
MIWIHDTTIQVVEENMYYKLQLSIFKTDCIYTSIMV